MGGLLGHAVGRVCSGPGVFREYRIFSGVFWPSMVEFVFFFFFVVVVVEWCFMCDWGMLGDVRKVLSLVSTGLRHVTLMIIYGA